MKKNEESMYKVLYKRRNRFVHKIEMSYAGIRRLPIAAVY